MLLTCYIYKSSIGDCSNGGISSKHNQVLLSTDPENDDLTSKQAYPIVKLVKRWGGTSNEYLHAEPVEAHARETTGYMAGGCFISTSDSRFPASYPVSLHDRTET